jgi:KUP system potassium uptake protein
MKSNHLSSEKITTATLLVALGITFGDIGTSPLYALRAVIGDRTITDVLVYGGVSCIFWTLVFQTTLKYVWITLKADNHGEGGIFSLYALVRRYGKKLVIPTILGATTLLADGIITPPISVASAVEGLGLVKGYEHTIVAGNSLTIGLVIVIISGLFFFQRFGTQKVGSVFGPVMTLWFSMLLVTGLVEISHFPDVLKALSPHYAYNLLAHYPHGFWLLGAVFLCTTGAEALYSDIGHCGVKNIRITWIFVKISLVTCYLGQAAWIMHDNTTTLNGLNPFFGIIPEWFLLPSIIIATCATIIASQALISGSYTLINEAMNLNFWPRINVRHPTELKGQIYIPSVNYILWFGCILMVLYFRSSTNMEAAYGFSITITMLMTTLLLSYFLVYRRKWNIVFIILFLLVFGIIESSFFITNVVKIKQRWMFLFFEGFIFTTMYVWYFARKNINRLTNFIPFQNYAAQLVELSSDQSIPKFSTHLIYLTKAKYYGEVEEKIIKSIFAKKPKRSDIYWFVHIHRTEDPYTMTYDVRELIPDKAIYISINVGFRIQPRTELFFKKVVQELVENKELNMHIMPDGSTKYNPEPDFKFIVIERFLSVENELTIREDLLLNTYFFLKSFGQNDQKAFGIEKSDVIVEQMPLLYHPIRTIGLKKNKIEILADLKE